MSDTRSTPAPHRPRAIDGSGSARRRHPLAIVAAVALAAGTVLVVGAGPADAAKTCTPLTCPTTSQTFKHRVANDLWAVSNFPVANVTQSVHFDLTCADGTHTTADLTVVPGGLPNPFGTGASSNGARLLTGVPGSTVRFTCVLKQSLLGGWTTTSVVGSVVVSSGTLEFVRFDNT